MRQIERFVCGEERSVLPNAHNSDGGAGVEDAVGVEGVLDAPVELHRVGAELAASQGL